MLQVQQIKLIVNQIKYVLTKNSDFTVDQSNLNQKVILFWFIKHEMWQSQ